MKRCKNPNDEDQCLRRIIRLCEVKERCSTELKKRLVAREGYSDNTFTNALSRATNVGLVNDIRYAEMYIISSSNALRGLNGIKKHLEACNIDYVNNKNLIELLNSLAENENERAYQLACNTHTNSSNPFRSTMAKLIRRGYDIDIAYKAVEKKFADINYLE